MHIMMLFSHLVKLDLLIGILPAYTRYRLVGKVHPPLVSNVEQVERAGQLHLRKGSRARLIKLHMSGAGQDHLRNHYSGSGRQIEFYFILVHHLTHALA